MPVKTLFCLIMRKAKNFYKQPWQAKIGLMPCIVLLGIAKLLIQFIPLKKLSPTLGVACGTNAWIPMLSTQQEARALMLGRLVRMSARYSPWKANCFAQAIVARVLLELYRIPYVMYFGVAPKTINSSTKAHAWVCTGKISVTGGNNNFSQFRVVGCFASPQLAKLCLS